MQEDMDREMRENQEMSKYLIGDPDKKIDMNDFLKKYNNQIKQWEARQKSS